MFAQIENNEVIKYPIPIEELRLMYSGTSIPSSLEAIDIEGIVFVDEKDIPYDEKTQYIEEGMPILSDGKWVRSLTVVDKTDEQMQQDTKVSVPTMLTPRQARLALLNAGLLDEAEALLANDRAMQIWWEYSLDIQRDHPMVTALAVQLDLDDEGLDNLFIEGAKL